MKKFKGKGVYGGVAIGKLRVINRTGVEVRRIRIDDIQAEKKRLENARLEAAKQLEEIYSKALVSVGEANARIFEIHLMMLEDEDYNESIENIIETQWTNAEYAVAVTSDNFAQMFSSMDDSYMQARASDVKDISNRIIECLNPDEKSEESLTEKVIICADDLAPSETVSLDKDNVLAFVTANGSSNSHTAILARNMNIPAIIGLGEEFLAEISDGMTAVVDGMAGELIIEPDTDTMTKMQLRQSEEADKRELLQRLRGKENVTLDGTRIKLYANIGSADNVGAVLLNDAEGIGLFRSEFIYLENDDFPTEEQQFSVYKKVLESMAGKKVIIRTLDIGADKQAPYFNLRREENPALGLRAVRLCLKRPDIFKTQLRALYRASAFGNLGIMFPMITGKPELERILAICSEVEKELQSEGIQISRKIEKGIMIETPAAAVISDMLAPMVDFFSVGTNDLIQYTLACDRQNADVEDYCDSHHEAVLRLIKFAADNAHSSGKWIGICGELAADTQLTERFLQMGIDELSVSPHFVLPLREKIRSIRLK
ncbi:MAG: phosphoenolpyruvate--protein phosphotransferase [Ruminococcus sp.]|nr:phosphoenolpyruvate--protein phosphotransferase [Ruminococcus sp.]